MFGKGKENSLFFEQLCQDYYEKILRYLYGALGEETQARDCTQEVFLVACEKAALLRQHPNPGGFLFQTAKNLAQKARRENLAQMAREISADSVNAEIADPLAEIGAALSQNIDETDYIDTVLARLSEEKRELYTLYYRHNKSMAEIAALLGLSETALRMRYVRLRREIRSIVAEVAAQNFTF